MKATRQNRTITVTNIPAEKDGLKFEPALEIKISYTGDGSACKGVTLDNLIIPAILAALNTDKT